MTKQIYAELSKKAHGYLEWAFIRINAFERELSKSPDLKRTPLNE